MKADGKLLDAQGKVVIEQESDGLVKAASITSFPDLASERSN